MVLVYLSLGSNIGNREYWLKRGVFYLKEEIKVIKLSSIYETEPVGYEKQRKFLNMVLMGKTALKAEELLNKCMEIESKCKRVREKKWSPRTLDIDILLYGNEIINKKTLKIPHPELIKRRFVLIPMMDISPSIFIPDKGITVKEALLTCKDNKKVSFFKGSFL